MDIPRPGKHRAWKLLALFAAIQMSIYSQNTMNIKNIELHDNWQFRQVHSGAWQKATVPGNVHADLLALKKIPDPFIDTNETLVQWIETEEWEYKTTFNLSRDEFAQFSNWDILFEGLDTYADVFINDNHVLSADNMFREWRVQLKHCLNEGVNTLRVLFYSPVKVNSPKMKALSYTLPAPNDAGKVKASVFTRKAPYHFGWDWGPRLVTCGIWKPVRLIGWNRAGILQANVKQVSVTGVEAKLEFVIDVFSAKADQEVSIAIAEQKPFTTKLPAGQSTLNIPVTIPYPRLWFPRGYGLQNLYTFPIKLQAAGIELDKKTLTTGLRSVKLIQDKDKNGTSFFFTVNDIPIFAKGADYIPQDNLLNRVTREHYDRVISAALDANMNMLRVWGGGIYEDDYFYELCDRNGILVWQDFMFACSMYPGDDAFLATVRQEITEQVRRIGNYASVALWCGNNEVDIAWKNWGWQEQFMFSKKDTAEIRHHYDTLFKFMIPELVRQYDGTRPYVHTSPLSNWGKKEYFKHGSMHYWGVWHGDEPFSAFRDNVPRFMVEYGFQSFPTLPAIEQFAAPAQFDINSPVMKLHQKSYKGNKTILKYLEKSYGKPESFTDFVYLSHLLQADGIGYAIGMHRLNKGFCMGTLFWQLNDCWYGPSWSAIDYSGRRKALYYRVKDAYKPVIAVLDSDGKQAIVSVVSDVPVPIQAAVTVEITDMYGSVHSADTVNITVGPLRAEAAWRMPLKKVAPGNHKESTVLRVRVNVQDTLADERLAYLTTPGRLHLPKPCYTLNWVATEDGCDLVIRTETLVKGFIIETKLPGIIFSDNYCDIPAGTEKVIHITGGGLPAKPAEAFTIRTVYELLHR